jgi:hypothetical protein
MMLRKILHFVQDDRGTNVILSGAKNLSFQDMIQITYAMEGKKC